MEGDRVFEVGEADAVYAVLYQGQPIKDGRASFQEPGHAVRLAKKLNAVHDTDAFTVGIMAVKRVLESSEND
jgi:hypothetical protein